MLWIARDESGATVKPSRPEELPGRMNGTRAWVATAEPGLLVLALPVHGSLDWVRTRDVRASDGATLREVAAPGIRSPRPVRAFMGAAGIAVLTDGMVEDADRGIAWLREVLDGRRHLVDRPAER